ncbi:MAG: hypothetical protein JXA69_14635 [Phycisphaerae bacterium]|nr:hypothetical protein [Phycisphaerae bacterium]
MAVKTRTWHGCYDDSWKGLIADEAFAHPAKFARGLIERIIAHGLGQGYWRAGQVIGDPFGGVALGGVVAGYYGLHWLGVELEEKFVGLGEQNLALHRPKFAALGYAVDVRLVQGDSRRFAEIVAADAIVTSPPYDPNTKHDHTHEQRDGRRGYRQGQGCHRGSENYGDTPGQIGRLSAGSVDGVITSPPYAESVHDGNGIDQAKLKGNPAGKNTQAKAEGYGQTPGNIGNLKAGGLDGVVTSPPWMRSDTRGSQESKVALLNACKRDGKGHGDADPTRYVGNDYGQTAGQIGNLPATNHQSSIENNQSKESYWQAMDAVYRQCFEALKPGGVMAVVVKDYVKDKARVPLVDDTLRLLAAVGFEPVERVRAMLVKETRKPDLFGGEIHTRKKRGSFFRRLAEEKAAARQYWLSVSALRQAALRERAAAELPGGSEKKILTKAQLLAYRADGKPYVATATEINYEEVLFVRKRDTTGKG